MKKVIFLLVFVVGCSLLNAQMQRDALTSVEDLIIYITTTKKPDYYDTTEWKNYYGTTSSDQGSAVWGCSGTTISGADGTAIGTLQTIFFHQWQKDSKYSSDSLHCYSLSVQ